jgi:hypothetical protein
MTAKILFAILLLASGAARAQTWDVPATPRAPVAAKKVHHARVTRLHAAHATITAVHFRYRARAPGGRPMLKRQAAGALIAVTLIGQAAAGAPITEADKAACRPDVMRLCFWQALGGATPAAIACMQRSRRQVSPACQAVMRRHGV